MENIGTRRKKRTSRRPEHLYVESLCGCVLKSARGMSVADCSSVFNVNSPEDIADLGILLLDDCRGADVEVLWDERIPLSFPLYISDGTSLTLNGTSPETSAIIGGGTATFPLVTAVGSHLSLRHLRVVDGTGGGIVGLDSSITAEHCVFQGNTVEGNGAAIRLDSGRLDLTNCTFSDNQAVSSSVFGTGSFTTPIWPSMDHAYHGGSQNNHDRRSLMDPSTCSDWKGCEDMVLDLALHCSDIRILQAFASLSILRERLRATRCSFVDDRT